MGRWPAWRCVRRAAQACWGGSSTLLAPLLRKGYRLAGLLLLLLSWGMLALPALAASFTLAAPPERPVDVALAASSPATAQQAHADLTVNPSNRAESLTFFQTQYLSSAESAIAWTGDLTTCEAGTTATAFRAAIVQRINYFRAMAGVPADVTLTDEYNHKAQAAALMMSSNQQLSHHPAPDWTCYTPDGATAAEHANLLLGGVAPSAIDGYMADADASNAAVGHRRWLLYPPTQHMGTGDIPPTTSLPAANVLWVVDEEPAPLRPATREAFVAWPPPGFVPAPVVFMRWSFSYPAADFSAATISMTGNGEALPVHLEPVTNGFGENTLVWVPEVVNQAARLAQDVADVAYQVQIDNIQVAGQTQAFSYVVTVFEPDAPVATPSELPTLLATRMPTATLTESPLAPELPSSTPTAPPTAEVISATPTPLAQVYLAVVHR